MDITLILIVVVLGILLIRAQLTIKEYKRALNAQSLFHSQTVDRIRRDENQDSESDNMWLATDKGYYVCLNKSSDHCSNSPE